MNRSTPSLEERIERLERTVAEIHARLDLPRDSSASGAIPAPSSNGGPTGTEADTTKAPPAPAGGLRRAEVWAHQSEQWLGRVGLALLFLGLVYLFSYSIEQGWITPLVRVGIGVGIASTLLTLGLRLQSGRRSYSQILLAGAVAVYYVSGWAAFQLYQLVSHSAAFLYMSAVMLLALVLARRQDQPALASLGAAGGFATPLLLDPGAGAVRELAVYSSLVVAWTGILFWLRGWPSLLWTYTAGALAALGIAAYRAEGGERWLVQASLALAWLLGAALPFVRGLVRTDQRGTRPWGRIPLALQLRALGVGATTATLLLSDWIWDWRDAETGGLFLAAAALYVAFAWLGTRTAPNAFARAAAPVGAALCAAGTYLLLDDDALRVAVLAAEALLFVYGGRGARFAGLESVGHPLFALLALSFLGESLARPRLAFDALAYGQLAMILLALVASLYARPRWVAWTYRLGAHALFLVWLAKELGPLSSGTELVTLAWGVYGAVLLIAALQWRDRRSAVTHGLQLVAFSALALAVLKLLLVDLGRVAMIWRILLFMGFGAAFLGLSALFKPTRRVKSEG